MLLRALVRVLALALPTVMLAQRAPRRPAPAASGAPRSSLDTAFVKVPSWRFVGPDGNRVIAVAGVPGEHRTYYAGAASGGLFKSTNGGIRWVPVTDSLRVSSVSAIAVATSDPNVVWFGTGETFLRSNVSIGDGIYRSTDAGRHWEHMGLDNTGRIGRVLIHPTNPDVVYAAAQGHGYGPQSDRGLWRTLDGGKSWKKVLFVNDSTGIIDVAMDPTNPRVLFAAAWQQYIVPWDKHSGGAGSGIWMSRDAGDTWTKVDGGADGQGFGRGLPKAGTMGKIGLGIARSDPNRLYALIEMKEPALYRSDDGGRSWRAVNRDHDLLERPQYYTRFAISPTEADRLYIVGVRFVGTSDGGLTKMPNAPRAGGDLHDIWWDPIDADRFVVGDDGGVGITIDGGKSFTRIALPNAQMYHVNTDTKIPYNLYGNRQDGYSYGGPSNSRGSRSVGVWTPVGGCESGWAIPDTIDGRTVWSGCYDAGLERFDLQTKMARAVEPWPEAGYGVAPKDLKYRFQWTFPIHISPHDHNTVYVGSQVMHKTTNGGQTWTIISPDLSTNDSTRQGSSGGLVTDNLFVENVTVLFAIAESPLQKDLIWAGTMDGLLHITRDGGKTWTNLTANVPGLPKWSTISGIEPSKYDAGTAYIAVDAHLINDRDPYIYRTADFGRTWTRISGDMPASVFSYVHVVREDPVRKGMLYAGTENALYVSLDDGAHWIEINGALPHAPVSWLQIQGHFHDLVVSTYGRGFWIADDISYLRSLADSIATKAATLLPMRAAYRFRKVATPTGATNSLVGGEDPPLAATINYTVGALPTDSTARDSVNFRVYDATGVMIRKFKGASARRGLNRALWDLRHEGPRKAKLRTAPPGNTTLKVADSRALVPWDLDLVGGQVGPLVAPGVYTVAMLWKGDTLRQNVEVRRDPNSEGTDADITAQVTLALRIRDALNETVALIDESEWSRRGFEQLRSNLRERLKDLREYGPSPGRDLSVADAESFLKEIDVVEKKVVDIESKLYDVALTGAREDAFRNPNQLYEKLASVGSDIAASSADFRPTDQHGAVYGQLREQLDGLRKQFSSLVTNDLSAFQARAAKLGVTMPVIF
ncbi:MAG: glycosyl hydrolase [Gemmatimonadaceae bacterium]|nr:glycosyl hydrolase [Gemmatimonadaceae bacterium]